MQSPSKPEDEEARVQALRSLSVLDTPPEERFDRYTRLVKRLFDVPIALVSLVDENRQWFKSRQGLGATETPRDISFCGHAILQSKVFVIEDASKDERFCDNPLVTSDPNIRFYAGLPLQGPSGYMMGTLCIIDRKPRTMSDEDIGALEDIGAMVAGELLSLELATTDALTGISNRRGFDQLCKRALARSNRSGECNSVLVLDMDGFKRINDELGHDVGDRALVEFSKMLLETFRESDVVARTGGDEFCVMLTGSTEKQALAAGKRLRTAVDRRNQTSGEDFSLAFSVGVSECLGANQGVAAAIHDADARMYEEKRSRRKNGLPPPDASTREDPGSNEQGQTMAPPRRSASKVERGSSVNCKVERLVAVDAATPGRSGTH